MPTGDPRVDWNLGTSFAGMAVSYARSKREPGWIRFVIASIHWKALHGIITPSNIEHGFFARIAQLAYCGSLN